MYKEIYKQILLYIEKGSFFNWIKIKDFVIFASIGCWLSGVDINTQQSFEALSERAVAVVVDPIQSVKGKVVIGK